MKKPSSETAPGAGAQQLAHTTGRQHLLVHRLSTDVLDTLLTGFTRDFKPQRTQKSQRLQNYAAFVVFVAD